MSEDRFCPWLVEAWVMSPEESFDDSDIACRKDRCAKWGLIERGAMTLVNSVYEPAPDIYGCTRR